MRYGLPYKGSKNAIAEWVVNQLPRAEVFVDAFFGGGAITHRAMITGKYERFVVNDIDGRLPELFRDCAYGKHTVENHPEWISHDEFNARKADDLYIALVWSFGNNGKDYLYGADIEDYKKAYHSVVYTGDTSALWPYGYNITLSTKTGIYERYLDYQAQIRKQAQRAELEIITRQNEIERLQSLQSLQSDYTQIPIPRGALIYCDPPYANTDCGRYSGFDSERFYRWAEKQDNIFISEYSMPENFIPIAETVKTVLSSQTTTYATERLYTNERTWARLSDDQKFLYRQNFAKQLTLEDI